MKRFAAFLAALVAMMSSFGAEYSWTGGGVSGKWDDSANWGGGGWPTGGDTANLSSAVTITTDFELGAGELTIVASADLTFDCTVSGAGGIYKQGAGALILKKDNTFSGGFKSTGTGTDLTGCVELYAGGGLGTGEAFIEAVHQKGSRLNVYGPLTVTTPVKFGADISKGTLWTTNDVTFAAKVSPASRFRHSTAGGGATVTFNEMNTGYGNWMPQVGKDDTMVFNEVVKFTAGCDIYSATAGGNHNGGHVVFRASGNDWMFFHVGSDSFVFDAENGLPARYKKLRFEANNARIDIAGHDQTVSYVETEFSAPNNYADYGFTNSSDTAALVSFEDFSTGLRDFTFNGQFFGKTGFKWAPASAEATFTLNGRCQPTTGDLIVSNGTVALTGGATFTSLARLEIGEAGVLSFDDNSGAAFAASALVLETGAQIRMGAKTSISVDSASTNGVALPAGVYGRTELPDIVTGSGVISVKGLPEGARTWTGTAGTGLWSDDGNWSGGSKPANGEDVVILSGTVTLDVSTPALHSLFVMDDATLSVSGWETKIEAESVNVSAGGVLTCAGGFTTQEAASRVWVVCTDLQVGVDGAIDLDGKGFAPNSVGGNGFGPSPGSYRYGASHGGPGGMNVGAGVLFCNVYDDPSDPGLPGSSGYWETKYHQQYGVSGNAGGGVLKVEASGTVSVYGTVSANGQSAYGAGRYGSVNDTAGAGGAISIACARFVARNGIVRAKGGDGDSAVNPSWQLGNSGFGQSGGGGMIAIRYGAGQTVGDVENTEISAACGLYTGKNVPVTLANQDIYWSNADLGSVWFTDDKIVEATLGKGLSGRVVNPSGFTTDGDLSITSGYVRFEGEGVSVSVGGDLTITGSSARFEVGGVCYTNRSVATDLYCGRTPVALSVGGDVMVSSGGRLDLRAAATNGVDRFGAKATIGGSLSVGAGSWVVAWCDVRNTGAPAFEVGGDFSVAAGGIVSASRRGGSGGWHGALYSSSAVGISDHGFGLGAGKRNAAGSYGGRGGIGRNKTVAKTEACGSEFYPFASGAGGGAASHGMAGSGGGLVFVKAAGAITVDGAIEANGGYSYYLGADAINNVSGGSGGSIFLSGRTFSGTGSLSVKGGAAMVDWYTPNGETDPVWLCSGAGGGGRIAVWTGEPVDESVRPSSRRVTSAETPIAGEGGFTGTTDVTGGSPVYRSGATDAQRVPLAEESVGEPGTVKFCKLDPKSGLLLWIR